MGNDIQEKENEVVFGKPVGWAEWLMGIGFGVPGTILLATGDDHDESNPGQAGLAQAENTFTRLQLPPADRIGERRIPDSLLDTDPYRDAVRDAVFAADGARVAELAAQDAALKQLPGLTTLLGECGNIPVERRRQLLQAAVTRRPGALGLLMQLGISYEFGKETADEQVRWFQAAVAAAPASAAAHINLGIALAGKGQVDEAIACYRKAIALDPKLANAHTNLGNALKDKGQVDEAIACYKKAIALDPKLAQVHYNLGNALDRKGKVDEAIACYHKAIALDPKYIMAHTNLGIALGKKGQLDAAIACFQKAIALDPKFAEVHYNLGLALDLKGKVDEAMTCYRKAIALDPKYALAHFNLGAALHGKGQVDEAIACYRQAIALDPKNAMAYANLGDALKDKGQVDQAIACYKKAIALDPKNATAHHKLGVVLHGKGQVDEAIACYRKAIALDAKEAAHHCSLGNALQAKGRVDEAIACYQKAIALVPKDARAHNSLGAILCDVKRDYDGAIACFQKAIALVPKSALAHSNLGNALLNKGQVDAAIASWRKAVELDAKLAVAHYSLGLALGNKGRLEEAIACFRKAIICDPKLAMAHCHLGKLLCKARATSPSPWLSSGRGHELGSKRPGWPYPSAAWVRQAERLAELEAKLPAFLKGMFEPRDNTQRLALIRVCQAKKLHRAATQLSADTFAADPERADDLQAGHRYNASCSAALAAAGQGVDATSLDLKERARPRQQALDWLRADLAVYAKRLQSGSSIARRLVTQQMHHWQKDSDLAGIRDKAALAKLPAEEQRACTQLWAEVAALLKKAQDKPK